VESISLADLCGISKFNALGGWANNVMQMICA